MDFIEWLYQDRLKAARKPVTPWRDPNNQPTKITHEACPCCLARLALSEKALAGLDPQDDCDCDYLAECLIDCGYPDCPECKGTGQQKVKR